MPESERLRVLRLIARLNVGGPAIQTINLSWRLAPLGYDSLLLCGRVSAGEGSMEYLADEAGVRAHDLRGLRRELGAHDLRAVAGTMTWLRRIRPHVLHTHTAKAGTVGRVAAMLSPGVRPPVIVHTFHGHVFKGEFSERKSLAFARIERSLARVATCIIAVSEEVKRDLIEFGVATPEKIEVVRLGFDLSPFASPDEAERLRIRATTRERLGVPQEAPVVSVIARVTKVKRIDRFLAMARHLPGDAHVVIAGDGDRRAELEVSPDAHALGDRLHWAGFQRDIPAICIASDVVALTSDNEGTPVCLIEAQAAGRPVVSTRVGGVQTVIRDGESGHIVGTGPREIAAAVTGLLDEPGRREVFGAVGRRHVVGTFSIDRLVADIDALYRRLLSDAPLADGATGSGRCSYSPRTPARSWSARR